MSHSTLLKHAESATHSSHGGSRAARQAEALGDNVAAISEEARQALADIMSDVEQIVTRVGPEASAEVRELVEAVRAKAGELGTDIAEAGETASSRIREGAHKAREVVRDRPVQSVLVAAFLGVALGAFIARR